MGLLDNVRAWFGGEKRAVTATSLRDPALVALFGSPTTEAGVGVSEGSSLGIAGVWAAVRVISETVASLPLILYQRQGNGRTRADAHPLYSLLHDQPNPETPALVWRETLLAHCLTWGNGYAEIERNLAGDPVSLWILSPDRVTVKRDVEGALFYEYRGEDGIQEIPAADVFHIRGLGFDGLQGYSVVRTARESLGLALACERFGARLFGSGAKPSGILTIPGVLSDDAKARLRREWNALHSGVTNAHGTAILEQGTTWTALGIPPEDCQFLSTRQFQLGEICRWFNVPPSKIRDTAGASYSSLEQENLQFLTETLRPWMVRMEQEIWAKLLAPEERRTLYAEFLVDGLLRADQAARYAAYAVGRNSGFLSVNEIRARENLDPIPGGDTYLAPLNMQEVGTPLGTPFTSPTPAVGTVPDSPPPNGPAPAAGASTPSEPVREENAQDYASDACIRLAEMMTEHQVQSCEHGSTNRCRICGIERERVLIPAAKPGGDHAWGIKWVPILPARPPEDLEDRALPVKYQDLDFTPPKGAREEAARGLEWRREHKRGGTAVGVARARDISNGVQLSPETVRRMASYFARHEVDQEGQGWKPGQDGYPSAGRIAWALWGGTPARSWAGSLVESMNLRDEGQ